MNLNRGNLKGLKKATGETYNFRKNKFKQNFVQNIQKILFL